MKIIVLGVNGLIGNEIFRFLSHNSNWEVYGTLRNAENGLIFPSSLKENLLHSPNLLNDNELTNFLKGSKPNVIINAVGITKHRLESENILDVIPINSLFPHRLAKICDLLSIRLIHISTDCVFSGNKGNYLESDLADAKDIYGKSKALGELKNNSSLTLRTSTIGYELNSTYGLLNWFLSQKETCKGYSRAIFSGLPASYFAFILQHYVIPNKNIMGLYNLASEPISKFDLLKNIADIYGLNIRIEKDDSFEIDRSLNADLFNELTGFVPPKWPELIKFMYQNQKEVKNV
jgi:dTDP-4-dehydrorhamnose reductase